MSRTAAAAALSMAGGVTLGAVTWLRIQRAGRVRARGHADMIVVLGAALNPDGAPCPELARRLDEGARLFRARGAQTILCCGGQDSDGRSEAEGMRAYLVESGVPHRAVLVDDDGPTTRRAVAAARRHSRDRGRALFVSSPYHMHRVLREAERQSLGAEGHAWAPAEPGTSTAGHSRRGWVLVQVVREILAVWWYALPFPDREHVIRRRIQPPTAQRLVASAATKWPVSIRVGQRSSTSQRSTRLR